MASSLRLINLLKQKRAIYSGSSKLLMQSVRSPLYGTNSGVNHASSMQSCIPQIRKQNFCSASTERASKSQVDKHEFKAETRMLLDIVARSLYSESEVFVRELISNASDALEKFRYSVQTSGEDQNKYENIDRPLEIHLETNKQALTLTIKDSGIGMNREELISNLGTIARSGSKQFLDEIQRSGNAGENVSNIIGQFGVGFYSAFMVANKVEVFTKTAKPGSSGLKWTSDGTGMYEIEDIDNAEIGTKIILYLKTECREYADDDRIKSVIKKYSNFVGYPVYLNKEQVNELQPLWLMDPKNITREQYDSFYRYVANTYLKPRFTLHYKADVPISIRALLFFPSSKPNLMVLSQSTEAGLALYTRKILIQSKVDKLLPRWLRFVKGVVDSEDIPLNLSRELLQNSALIAKLRNVLTSRILRHLQECAKKEPTEYEEFYNDYNLFFKEGIISSDDIKQHEEIGKLLRYNSNRSENKNQKISLTDYCARMEPDQNVIYYLATPNRELAESSPYFEALKSKKVEVLFCYDPYDELVLSCLKSFAGKDIISVEKEMRADTNETDISNFLDEDSLQRSQINELTDWIQKQLEGKVVTVKVTTRLVEHPCVITVENMADARHFIRTQSHQIPEENRYAILQPQLEINPKHPIIKKLFHLKDSNPELSQLLINQLFGNAMLGARLIEDAQSVVKSINELLTKALEKH